MRITSSMRLAISTAIRLEAGTLQVRLKGSKQEDPLTIIKPPRWGNFEFFDRIRPAPILRSTNPDNGERLDLQRRVRFYHLGHHVADIQLAGYIFREQGFYDDARDKNGYWAVSDISYAPLCFGDMCAKHVTAYLEVGAFRSAPFAVR